MMKKFLVCLMVLSMVWTVSFAEEIDLTAMSMDELYILRQRIDSEIHSRYQVSEGVLYPGIYVVGKDIKPGFYLIECVEVTDAELLTHENPQIVIDTYNSVDDLPYHYRDQQWLYVGKKLQLNLSEGMAFEVVYGIAKIITLEKPSWTP